MRLSVLDQSIVSAGSTPKAAVQETLALAKACDGFGYHRFWVSEHHGYDGLAGSAPEVLLGALAVATARIRIGSAASILPHSSPLKIAEQFAVLDALAPGRVDLGIGRGPGAARSAAYALNPAALDNPLGALGFDRFPQDVADLLHLSTGRALPDGHEFAGVRAMPASDLAAGGEGPEPWIVGGTSYTARLAGSLGLSYCFAHFVADGIGAEETIEAYHSSFVPGPFRDTPYLGMCAFAFAARSAAEAETMFLPYALWRMARDSRRFVPFQPVSDVAGGRDGEIEALRARSMFGDARSVAADLRRLKAAYDADEIVIQSPAYALVDRVDSLRLIAEAAGDGASDEERPPMPAEGDAKVRHGFTHTMMESAR
jgi:luciferase family oxidoreductase group 1